MPYSGNGQVSLAYTEGKPFSGWNLIGNPFNQAAYLADGRAFYVMKSDGSEIIAAPTTATAIEAMQGIFVVAADADDNSVTFSRLMLVETLRATSLQMSISRRKKTAATP